MTPEEKTRQEIGAQLTRCGWVVQTKDRINLSAPRGVVMAEQTRIVAEVERQLSVVAELEWMVTANLQRAVRLRQSILQMAFSGELV